MSPKRFFLMIKRLSTPYEVSQIKINSFYSGLLYLLFIVFAKTNRRSCSPSKLLSAKVRLLNFDICTQRLAWLPSVKDKSPCRTLNRAILDNVSNRCVGVVYCGCPRGVVRGGLQPPGVGPGERPPPAGHRLRFPEPSALGAVLAQDGLRRGGGKRREECEDQRRSSGASCQG